MWHQPIFSLIRIYNNNISLNILSIIISSFIISIISFLSFKYIEQPYRNKKTINKKKFVIHILTIYLLILFLGSFILVTKGLFKYQIYENMYPNISFGGKDILTQNTYRDDHLNYIKKNNVDFLLNEYSNNIKILVIGNSKGADLFMALNQEPRFNENFVFDYKSIQNLGLEEIRKTNNFKIADTIIMTLEGKNINDMKDAQKFFNKYNKEFFIVSHYPYFNIINDDPLVVIINKWHVKHGYNKLIEKNYLEKEIYKLIKKEYFEKNLKLIQQLKQVNIPYLNPVDYICPNLKEKKCYGVTHNFEKIYFDNTHTTLAGSQFFGKIIYETNWLSKINKNNKFAYKFKNN